MSGNKSEKSVHSRQSSQQNNFSYQALYLWTSFLLGMISLGMVIWNRRSIIPAQAGVPGTIVIPVQTGTKSSFLNLEFLDSRLRGNDDSVVSATTYQINFPNFASSVALGALAYQLSENPFVGLLSTWSLLLPPIFTQSSGLLTIVPEFQVNTNKETQGSNNLRYIAACGLSSGPWVMVWSGNQSSDYDIYMRVYSENGSTINSESRVNTITSGDQNNPAIMNFVSGGWMIAWDSNAGMYVQRYAENGTNLGSEILISSNISFFKSNPAIASFSTGVWVITWVGYQSATGSDIYAQLYTEGDNPLGLAFRVNTNTTSQQDSPATVTLLSKWVVVWEGLQTGDYDIYAQLYAGNNSAIDQEFRVNTNTTADQSGPVVASFPSGEWIVAWFGNQADGAFDYDIYAQRYATDGGGIGQEFRVNTNTTGTQFYPTITIFPSGEALVTWLADDQTGYYNIHAQRYAVDGNIKGPEFRMNSVATMYYEHAITLLSSDNWAAAWRHDENRTFSNEVDIYASIFSFNDSGTLSIFSTTTSSSTITPRITSGMTTLAINTTAIATTTSTTLSQGVLLSSTAIPTVSSTIATTKIENQTNTFSLSQIVLTSQNSGSSRTTSNEKMSIPVSAPIKSSSPSTLVPIVAGAAVGGFGLAACLAGIGFYACRKKPRANQSNDVALKAGSGIATTTAGNMKEYANFHLPNEVGPTPAVNANQPNEYDVLVLANRPLAVESAYAIIDETKMAENEYDHPAKLEI